ncbi:High-affinity choline transport protein [Methanosarcina sp. MTP4]|uniref:hypothetical protein n=1 Tax=Methanosarcina sp. MTP4 TaxID=1434100 RepID=UPI0006154925|nr:hypothetical protein [Methanosarcina sp. MTP4]AKB25684.1 High-affinity choline transport protein [Methanosarcina sp. MTP4]
MNNWKGRLRDILEGKIEDESEAPVLEERIEEKAEVHVTSFIENSVLPAFRELSAELEKHKRCSVIDVDEQKTEASLKVYFQDAEEFYYAVRGRTYQKGDFAFPQHAETQNESSLEAEVILRSGSHHMGDINSFSMDDIIKDFLDEYSKWAKF